MTRVSLTVVARVMIETSICDPQQIAAGDIMGYPIWMVSPRRIAARLIALQKGGMVGPVLGIAALLCDRGGERLFSSQETSGRHCHSLRRCGPRDPSCPFETAGREIQSPLEEGDRDPSSLL
jgi:hypothetical protein